MKRTLIIALSLSFIVAFLPAAVPAYVIKGTVKDVDVKDVRIDGRHYLLLMEACEANGIDWQWDNVSRRITLYKDGREAVFLVGSKYYKSGTKTRKLSAPVVMKGGAVYVPLKFAKYGLKRLFYIKRQKTGHVDTERTAYPAKPARTRKARRKRFKIEKIMIDPGHGGKDPGAIGKTGLKEKGVVLDVARRIAKELKKKGITVILTRDSDRFISLSERTDIANKKDTNLFVSIHANASRSRWPRGFEVYYLSEATDDTARALATAENSVLKYEEEAFFKHTKTLDAIVWDLKLSENREESIELSRFICREVGKRLKMKKNKTKSARFYVLRGAKMPAVLVELSYLSNKWDEKNLRKSGYKQKLADGVASGIIAFKEEYERQNGFSQ